MIIIVLQEGKEGATLWKPWSRFFSFGDEFVWRAGRRFCPSRGESQNKTHFSVGRGYVFQTQTPRVPQATQQK